MNRNRKDPDKRFKKIAREIKKSNSSDLKSKKGKFETSKIAIAPVGFNGYTFTAKWAELQKKGSEKEIDVGECYASLIIEKRKAGEKVVPLELLQELENRYM